MWFGDETFICLLKCDLDPSQLHKTSFADIILLFFLHFRSVTCLTCRTSPLLIGRLFLLPLLHFVNYNDQTLSLKQPHVYENTS